ncbi:MAG: TolC family protein, partial [Chitinophagaceae bacterium]|nr:TolC family protein [Chitinophagaceae bacterium]
MNLMIYRNAILFSKMKLNCSNSLLKLTRVWLLLFSCLILNPADANSQTLNEKEFIAIVLKYHPIARKSFLGIESAKAEVTISRGEFDPVLEGGNQQKELSNTTYYQYSEGRIRIPTWYGIEVNAGFERAQGDYINPERTEGTLGYLGVQFPLLQNLVIDKRRAALQKAQLMVNLSQYEQQLILNDLVLEAVTKYWMWVQEVQNLELIRKTRENVRQRLDWVNTSIVIGERAPIDSVEAL